MVDERRDILFRFLGDSRQLERSSRGTDRALGRTERNVGRLTKAVGAMGLAFGAREVGQFALDAAEMARQSNIAANSADKALGPAAERMRRKYEDLRKQVGLNVLEFDQYMARQGLIITGMGAGKDAAADYSGAILELGGDLAAFVGETERAPEAIDAIGAAIRGEFDPLEQWGAKLSEAKVKAEIARREGMDPLFASLSEGEQRLEAIVGLVRDSTVPALGALGDAAEQGATKGAELRTELEDLKIELGRELEPAMTDVTEAAVELAPALGGVVAVVAAMERPTGRATDALEVLGDAEQSVWEKGRAAVDGLGALAEKLNPIAGLARATSEALFGTEEPLRTQDDLVRVAAQRWSGLAASLTAAGNAAGHPGLHQGSFPIVDAGPGAGVQRRSVSARNPMTGARIYSTTTTGQQGGLIRHGGGIVPGRPGTSVQATLKAGERVVSEHESGGAGGIVIHVHAGISSPQDTARAIVDVLAEYNRNQGPIPIDVRNADGMV